MCIRALDYCPPVDITFGDYLRAIVTADFEHDPVDEEHRRVAFVEAFRRRGIVPDDVQAFSVDGLLWRPASAAPDEDEEVVVGIVKQWAGRHPILGPVPRTAGPVRADAGTPRRAPRVSQAQDSRRDSVVLSGIDPDLDFEVHSLRPSFRMDWEGKPMFQWVIELTQRIPQYARRGRSPRRGTARLLLPRRLHAARGRRDRKGPLQHQEEAGRRAQGAAAPLLPGRREQKPCRDLLRTQLAPTNASRSRCCTGF